MFSKVVPFFLHALTSVHAGSGSEIGIVDLPIQREKHTGYPKIEGSSLKGSIRAIVEAKAENKGDFVTNGKKISKEMAIDWVFGERMKKKTDGEPQSGDISQDDLQSSAIALADARTLLFPVKSMLGVFGFLTSPGVIERFNYEVNTFSTEFKDFSLPLPKAMSVSSDHLLVGKRHIVLEEYPYEMSRDEETEKLAESLEAILFPDRKGFLANRLAVVSDDDFGDFVKLSTEVTPRIRINPETGTVDNNALFYEENLPPETILYSFLFVANPRVEKGKNHLEMTSEEIFSLMLNEDYFPEFFQLGGDATLGRGMLRRIFLTVIGHGKGGKKDE